MRFTDKVTGIAGDTHAKIATKLEKSDASVEDPYSLPPERGLKSYFLAWNTWSIDGLPGIKMGAERTTKEGIKKMMLEQGLTDKAQALAASGANKSLDVYVAIILGILLGVAFTLASQRLNHSLALHDIRHVLVG